MQGQSPYDGYITRPHPLQAGATQMGLSHPLCWTLHAAATELPLPFPKAGIRILCIDRREGGPMTRSILPLLQVMAVGLRGSYNGTRAASTSFTCATSMFRRPAPRPSRRAAARTRSTATSATSAVATTSATRCNGRAGAALAKTSPSTSPGRGLTTSPAPRTPSPGFYGAAIENPRNRYLAHVPAAVESSQAQSIQLRARITF